MTTKITNITIATLIAFMMLACSTKKGTTTSSKKDYSRTEVDGSNVGKKGSASDQTTIVGINDLALQLGGEWNIETVGNKKVTGDNRAYLHFDFKNNRLYGNNGCNYINGTFTADAAKLTFSEMISTMMACANATTERAVMKALGEVESFKLTEKNGVHYLQLLNAKGHSLMKLRRQNVNFVDGAWTVKEIAGNPVEDKEVRLVIDTEQLKIHGCTGCNIVNGGIYIDTTKDRAIQFQQLISTRKMCPNMSTETALLVALEETYFCEKVNDNEIKFIDEKGNVTVVLTKLDLEK